MLADLTNDIVNVIDSRWN